MKIARVFATKTNMCPTDPDVYFDEPDLFTPQYDEAHISITFTWAKEKGYKLAERWRRNAKKVLIGGVAIEGESKKPMMAGQYLRLGVTITTRGCPNKKYGRCPWCMVDDEFIEFDDFPEGNIIQDNNVLACSKQGWRNRVAMFKTQKQLNFSGGLESSRITDEIVEDLRGLKIYQLWLSFDDLNREKSLIQAVNKLNKYFKRDKIRCYVLIGYEGDTLEKAETRLRRTWEIGTLPFAMRYRTPDPQWQGTYLFKKRAWNLFQRQWTHPAIIKSRMKEA